MKTKIKQSLVPLLLFVTTYLNAQTLATGYGLVSNNQGTGVLNERIYMWVSSDSANTVIDTSIDNAYAFSIDLGPTQIPKTKNNESPTAELLGEGQDYILNYTSETRQGQVSVYDITGKVINQIQPEWNSTTQIATAYWNGKGQNDQKLPNGAYIIATSNGISKKAIELNTGNYIGKQETSNIFQDKIFQDKSQEVGTKSLETLEKWVQRRIDPDSIYMPYQDSVLLHDGYNGWIEDIILDSIPQTQDITVKLVDGYTHDPLVGFTVRYKFPSDTSTIIQSLTTDTNGNATFIDVPADSTMYLEYGGDTAYFASKGNLWNLPSDIIFQEDTTAKDTIRLSLVKKDLPIPARPGDPNYGATISPTADEIKEIVAPSEVNLEECMGRPIRLNLDPAWNSTQKQQFINTLDETDSLFYGEESSPFVIVQNAIDLTFVQNNILNYNHINNFFPDTLGWNMRDGPPTTYAKIIPG